MNKSCGATSTSSMKFMPSTSISRSPPDPNLSKIGRTLSLSHLNPSKPSSCSTHTSSKSSWTYWASRVGKLIGKKSLSSTHSDLTEETLIAHNRRNRGNIVDNDYSNSSPYYRGVITAPPLNLVPGTSPRPKSHVTSISTASSFSSFIDIMKELGSCFRPVKVTERDKIKPADYATRKPLGPSHAATVSSSSTSISARQPKGSLFRDMNEAKKIKEKALLVDKEKPLRERVPESIPKPKPTPTPTPTPTLTPVPAPTLALPSSKDQVIINDKDNNEKLNEMREFVWANKYRPKALEDFICNRDKAMGLRTLMREGGYGHVIFEGQPGVGKRTMIWAMLRDAFGPDRIQARDECKAFKLKVETEGKIEVNIKQSPQHIEVNLSKLKGYEKHVILELMKETGNMISKEYMPCDPENCQAIILYEVDKLSTDALVYIRWLLERNKGCNKFFFCCSDVSKLQPIKSVCTVVQLLQPTNKEIVEVLKFIAKQEGIELPHQLAEKIAEKSKNNLRQAIRSFEATRRDRLYIIRGKLQNLSEHNLSRDFIFESLVIELKKLVRIELQNRIDTLYGDYKRENNKGMHEEMDKRLIN